MVSAIRPVLNVEDGMVEGLDIDGVFLGFLKPQSLDEATSIIKDGMPFLKQVKSDGLRSATSFAKPWKEQAEIEQILLLKLGAVQLRILKKLAAEGPMNRKKLRKDLGLTSAQFNRLLESLRRRCLYNGREPLVEEIWQKTPKEHWTTSYFIPDKYVAFIRNWHGKGRK